MSNFWRNIIVLTFATSPFIFLKLDTLNLSLFDVMLIFVALVVITKGFPLEGNYKSYYLFSWVFLLVSWLSIFKATDVQTALFTTLQYTFILLFLFPTVSKILNFNLYKTIVVGMCSLWSLFAIWNLSIINDPSYLWGGGAGRFVSLFVEPGEVGVVTTIMTPFLIYSLMEMKSKGKIKTFIIKTFFLAGIISTLTMLIASGSRSGLVALAVGLLLLLILRFGLSLKSLSLSAIFIVLSIFITSRLGAERNALSRLLTNENISVRFDDYRLVYDMLKDYFFLGTGLGASGTVIQQYGGFYRPHNFFLDIAIEAGVIGVVSTIIIILSCLLFGFKMMWNVILNNKKANLLVAATFTSGVILLVCQQFTTISNYRGYWVIWAFCLWLTTQSDKYYVVYEEKEKVKKREIYRQLGHNVQY